MYSSLDLPHPRRAAGAFGLLAVCALVLDAAPSLPWIAGVVAAGLFGVAGVFRTIQMQRELAAVRRSADRLITYTPSTRDASELVRWRSGELTSRPSRDLLAREIDRLLRSVDDARLPSAAPVRRIAVRRERALFVTARDALAGQRPISARGVLLLRAVLHEAASPLYSEETEELLGVAVRRALGALEP
jgi:hypothetical protein